jgi:large subunit ribosomal protein L17
VEAEDAGIADAQTAEAAEEFAEESAEDSDADKS